MFPGPVEDEIIDDDISILPVFLRPDAVQEDTSRYSGRVRRPVLRKDFV